MPPVKQRAARCPRVVTRDVATPRHVSSGNDGLRTKRGGPSSLTRPVELLPLRPCVGWRAAPSGGHRDRRVAWLRNTDAGAEAAGPTDASGRPGTPRAALAAGAEGGVWSAAEALDARVGTHRTPPRDRSVFPGPVRLRGETGRYENSRLGVSGKNREVRKRKACVFQFHYDTRVTPPGARGPRRPAAAGLGAPGPAQRGLLPLAAETVGLSMWGPGTQD